MADGPGDVGECDSLDDVPEVLTPGAEEKLDEWETGDAGNSRPSVLGGPSSRSAVDMRRNNPLPSAASLPPEPFSSELAAAAEDLVRTAAPGLVAGEGA